MKAEDIIAKYVKFREGGFVPQENPYDRFRYNTSDNTRIVPTQQKVLTTEESKKQSQSFQTAEALRKKQVQAQKDAEVKARMTRIAEAEYAKTQPINTENLSKIGNALGDKMRFSYEPNLFDDYLNPFVYLGDMAGGIGNIPANIKSGNYGKAAFDIANPALTGGMASAGSKNAVGFVNELFNPFAGLDEALVQKAERFSVYDLPKLTQEHQQFELETIRNNINLSNEGIVKLKKYLDEVYDYANLTPFQKKKILDRETYYLNKNNVSVDQRIQNNKNLLTHWENYKKDRIEYFNSPKFRERVNKQYGEMSDEIFKEFKEGLLQNLEKRPYIRPDVVSENAVAHYNQDLLNKIGIDNHKYGHTYFTDEYASDSRVVFHEGRHQLTNAEDEFYFFPSRKEIEEGLVYPDVLKFDSDLTNPKTGADYFLAPEEFITRLDELKRDMSKVGYDYKNMDLTPEILKQYRGLTPREAISQVTGKSYGDKISELTPEQHEAIIQLIYSAPDKTKDSQRLLRWFKDDFLLNQINNKWGLVPPAAIIGAGASTQQEPTKMQNGGEIKLDKEKLSMMMQKIFGK